MLMDEQESQLTRRDLLVRGGGAAASLGLLGKIGLLGAEEDAHAALKPKRGGVAKIALNTANQNLNPVTHSAQVDFFLTWNMYRGLTNYDVKKKDFVLDMAEDFSVSRNGKIWTYKLRKGILYHDGGEVVAKDVKFSVDTKVNPKNKSFWLTSYPVGIKTEVVDKYTVRFVLPRRSVQLPSALAQGPGHIFPQRAYKNLGSKPMGCGPFEFVSWTKGQQVVMKRFNNFFHGAPYLDRIIWVTIPEGSSRVSSLLAGDVQIIDQVPFEQIASLKKNGAIKMVLFPSTWIDFMLFNCTTPPFNNPEARNAIAMAVDREALAKIATVGTGSAASTLVSSWSPVRPTVKVLPYDPAQAQAIVKKLNLGSKQLRLLTSSADFPAWGRFAQYVAASAQKVGFNVTIQDIDLGTWVQRSITTRDFEMSICGFIYGIEADQRTYAQLNSKGALNWGGYNGGAGLDALTEAQRAELNPTKRAADLSKLWQQAENQSAWYTPYVVPGAQATAKNVQNYHFHPEFYPLMDKVWLS